MKNTLIKYILIAMIFGFNVINSYAQISANLVLNSRPPSYLSDWNNGRAGQLILTYTATNIIPIEIKLVTKIQNESGEVIAKSNTNMAKSILINTKQQIISMDRVLQLENLQFLNTKANEDPSLYVGRSGKLSPGQYTLIVEIINAKTGQIIVEQMQRRFIQVNYVLPYLLSPANEALLDANIAQSTIVFRWSNLVPLAQEAMTFRLTVFEIQSQQTPLQALRSNQPILDINVNRTTQYIWRPQMDLKNSSVKKYIWAVQSIDGKGQPISTMDDTMQGRSEPSVFGICNDKGKCSEEISWTSN
jgi:hypothetical protein